MNEKILGVVLLVVFLFIAYRFLKWLLGPKHIKPMSEDEVRQRQILKKVEDASPLPRKDKPGCGGWFMFFVIIIVIALACLLAYKGGFEFHP
jgi:UDP-N-acetylmuramyl pentapeptide phosphotransferase/UDP-N-acetylglucosamine-1-phosphate transferase